MSGAPDNVTLAKAPAIKFAKNAAATNRLSASMTTGGRSAAIVISSGSQRLLGSTPMKDEVQGRNDLRRSVLDALNAAAPALENLNTRQEQCDADGVMVKVSRQALDEVLSAVNQVAFQAAITPTPIADSSEAGTGGVAELLAAIRPHMIALSVTDDAAEYKSLVRRIDAALSAPLGEPVAWRYRRKDGTDIPLGEQCREAEEEGRAALSAALAAMWQPIENAKPNTSYILGWHDWRDGQWCMEIGPAITGERFPNGYSSVSHHGSATHFAPRLPAPSQLSKRDDAERDSPQEA